MTKRTRADRFLEEMNRVVPWAELAMVAAPHYRWTGTVVDATILSAPSSTKNKDGKRDP